MAINIKERMQLVSDVIAKLKETLPENTDYSNGTVLRDLIEAIMEQVDIQYWQLERAYESGFIDDVANEDLEKYVAILGVTRLPALKSTGQVTFYRTTAAVQNHFIPQGTLVETLPDTKGITYKFQTTKDAVLLAGGTEVTVLIEALNAGILGNVSAMTIRTISTPPSGIEFVKNTEPTSGGANIETDDALRYRAKHVLDAIGLGTVDAILNKVLSVPGVKEVAVQDMARGIGTVNVLVLTDTIPMTQTKKDEINAVISKTKGGGIDVLLIEPTVTYVNVNINLVMQDGHFAATVEEKVRTAVTSYIDTLDIGQTMFINQLRKNILNSSDLILDVNLTTPVANITATPSEILRSGTITIT